MSELEVFGTQCLDLLGDAVTVTVLVHLSLRATGAAEIQRAADGLSYRVARSRLRTLLDLGLVDGDDPPSLLRPGRAILEVLDVAATREARWTVRREPFSPPGARALAVAADRESRALVRALAHERLRVSDLETLLPEISHATLERRLRDREALGLVKTEKEGRDAWRSLTDEARRLVSVDLHAAQWDWAFAELDKGSTASDLAGLVHRLAPLVSLPAEVNGICVLHEDWHTTLQSDVYLAAHGGRLTPFILAPLDQPAGRAQGTPRQWTQALLSGDATHVKIVGDHALLMAVIAALAEQLHV